MKGILKKLFLFLLIAVLSLSAFACAGGNPPDGDGDGNGDGNGGTTPPVVNTNPLVTIGSETTAYEWGATDSYDLSTVMTPIWQTRNVYFETVTFLGKNDTAKLLYTPTKILAVYDYGLQIAYEKDVDYKISGNVISLTENTRINHWKLLEYYSKGDGLKWLDHVNGVDSIYLDEYKPGEHQIAICYEHADKWTGPVPIGQSDKFPKTIQKLKDGETVNIGIIGDSITEGCGASSYNKVAPYDTTTDFKCSYADLINRYLCAKFPNATINYTNKALGGMGSEWGVQTTGDAGMGRFVAETNMPDLFIIAWGMNDSVTEPELFKQRMESIAVTAKELNPDCELLFVSTMIPNPEAARYTGYIPQFEDKLIEMFNGNLAEETKTALGDTKIGVAPMMAMSKFLYQDTKIYADIGSNNVNHSNDFLHRIEAQVVLKTLLGNDFTIL